MKKSVILIIGIVYIVSIVIVGFFGGKMQVYNPTIYVEDISYTIQGEGVRRIELTPEAKLEQGCDDYYIVPFSGDSTTIGIKCEVIPQNATNASVEFYFNAPKNVECSYENNNASITFREELKMVYVTIQSTDGTNLRKVLKLLSSPRQ